MPRSKTRGAGNADANSESAMVIDTAFLDGLQGEDVRKSLEAINELRTCGLGDLLDLPEIVVCGDQSAGKSSLLARLTQVPFPQAEGICTRFATQITLRNTDTKSVTIKILPGSGSSTAERKKLLKFTKELKDFENFQQLIDEATTCMGLKALGNGHNAFSTHRLCIEITGPECGHFSLLDLPGLIRTDTDVHTRGDLDFVKRLHDEVLANNRAIILAVMPATIDLAVHEILTICQRHDPTGSRTLGIITKPDRLHPGSQQEKSYLDLFKNKGKKLQLGWYVVMNQPIDGKDSDFELRARHEHKFVGSGNWVAVPSDRKGIDSLRRRVSRLRVEQHKRDLPDLLNETTRIMRETLRDLNVLGDRRTDVDQQRKQLRDLSIKVSNIVCGAVSGNFNNDFFDVPGRGKGIDPRHLSAVVAQLQDLFAARIEVFGHKYQFTETHDTPGTNTLSKHDWSKFPGVRRETDNMTRAQAIEWVAQLHMHTRGLELPGAPSTSLVWDAFREQSGPWEELAKEHIIKVERACSILMKEVILKQAPRDLRDNLLDHVDGYLLRRFRNAEDELQKLIEDKKSSTTMYPYQTRISIRTLKSWYGKFNY